MIEPRLIFGVFVGAMIGILGWMFLRYDASIKLDEGPEFGVIVQQAQRSQIGEQLTCEG